MISLHTSSLEDSFLLKMLRLFEFGARKQKYVKVIFFPFPPPLVSLLIIKLLLLLCNLTGASQFLRMHSSLTIKQSLKAAVCVYQQTFLLYTKENEYSKGCKILILVFLTAKVGHLLYKNYHLSTIFIIFNLICFWFEF